MLCNHAQGYELKLNQGWEEVGCLGGKGAQHSLTCASKAKAGPVLICKPTGAPALSQGSFHSHCRDSAKEGRTTSWRSWLDPCSLSGPVEKQLRHLVSGQRKRMDEWQKVGLCWQAPTRWPWAWHRLWGSWLPHLQNSELSVWLSQTFLIHSYLSKMWESKHITKNVKVVRPRHHGLPLCPPTHTHHVTALEGLQGPSTVPVLVVAQVSIPGYWSFQSAVQTTWLKSDKHHFSNLQSVLSELSSISLQQYISGSPWTMINLVLTASSSSMMSVDADDFTSSCKWKQESSPEVTLIGLAARFAESYRLLGGSLLILQEDLNDCLWAELQGTLSHFSPRSGPRKSMYPEQTGNRQSQRRFPNWSSHTVGKLEPPFPPPPPLTRCLDSEQPWPGRGEGVEHHFPRMVVAWASIWAEH